MGGCFGGSPDSRIFCVGKVWTKWSTVKFGGGLSGWIRYWVGCGGRIVKMGGELTEILTRLANHHML